MSGTGGATATSWRPAESPGSSHAPCAPGRCWPPRPHVRLYARPLSLALPMLPASSAAPAVPVSAFRSATILAVIIRATAMLDGRSKGITHPSLKPASIKGLRAPFSETLVNKGLQGGLPGSVGSGPAGSASAGLTGEAQFIRAAGQAVMRADDVTKRRTGRIVSAAQ